MALGIVVMTLVVVLQSLAQLISTRDPGRFFSVMFYLAMEMPPLIVGLSSLYRWTRRHDRGSSTLVGYGVLFSGILGALCGGLFWLIAIRIPELGLHTSSVYPLTLDRTVGFGFTQALSHFGLWALAFVLPQLLEDAQVKSLEADKLKLEA